MRMRLTLSLLVVAASSLSSRHNAANGFSFSPSRLQSITARRESATGQSSRRRTTASRLHATVGPSPGLSIGTTVGFDCDEQPAEGRPSTSVAEQISPSPNAPGNYDAVVVGGGPAGLLSAIMLARQLPNMTPTDADGSGGGGGPRIAVYDRLPPPPPPDDAAYSADVSKYYLLGLGHRGQRALKYFDAWDDVEAASVEVLGRRDWAPGKSGEEDSNVNMSNKAVTSRILARDKLVGVLKRLIERRYGDVVELNYGYQVDPISFGNEGGTVDESGVEGNGLPVLLRVSRCIPIGTTSGDDDEAEECSVESADAIPTIVSTNFLIGSDGAARTIANAMEANDLKVHESLKSIHPLKRLIGKSSRFRVKRYEDDNPRAYKSVPIKFPPHWPHDLNYSARSRESRVTFEALPSDAEGNYCALLLLRPDDELASANCDPKVLRTYLDEEFPQFSKLLGDDVVADVARKGASALPSFRYAGPRLHEGGRTVLLGDCVHTVKPYFGLGANTALEDVMILSEILSDTRDLINNLHAALAEFTRRRAADSKSLVTLSRNMDRPGKLGTMRFVLPLILDSTFHKIAPGIFAPNMFGMFQREGVGFRRIQTRKKLDRAMQSAIILSALSLAGAGMKYSVKNVARLVGVTDAAVGGALAVLAGVAGVARKKMAKVGEK